LSDAPARRSLLARADPARIRYEPFPHVIVPEALDPAWYEELERSFPSFERIAGGRKRKPNKVYHASALEVVDDPEIPKLWRDFFAYHVSGDFFRELAAFWAEAIRREYPDLEARLGRPLDRLETGPRHPGVGKAPENRARDAVLDVQFSVNSPVETAGRVRGPHVDRPQKLFAALLYFRRADDDAPGGDLDLYRFRSADHDFDGRLDLDDAHVERFATVPYRPNMLVSWLNTARSLHGVTPRPPNPATRRYVNVMAEFYRLPGGFFPIRRTRRTRALRRVRRVLGFRDA
jgi:hypothetical protein